MRSTIARDAVSVLRADEQVGRSGFACGSCSRIWALGARGKNIIAVSVVCCGVGRGARTHRCAAVHAVYRYGSKMSPSPATGDRKCGGKEGLKLAMSWSSCWNSGVDVASYIVGSKDAPFVDDEGVPSLWKNFHRKRRLYVLTLESRIDALM